MTTQDMDILAHKIVSLEKRHNALARAQQLPNSSVRLVDGADVGLAESAEATRDIGDEAAYLGDWLTDADNNLDDNAEYGVEVPEWIQDAGHAGDVAWDSTQFATDLALTLDTELTQAQQELEQAQIDLTQALADSATALQEAQEALQEAEDAVTAADTATAAASAAEATAQAAQTAAGTAQTAAGNAQTAADQAAADALAAANAASDAQDAAEDAQTTADAKGKVIIQPGAPNAADRLPQNLWIDTTGGNNTPKRWDGSDWVVVTDKAATDAAAAAVTAQGRADDAYNEALSAATAAGNAQSSADGKTTNWYQNDAPAGTAHKVGDTWFDTNDGNRIYRWNGSWVAAQFGTNAISDTAINASKLAANAVTEGKILNGAITNDKLNTAVQNAITTAQSTASNAQTVANSAQSVANAAQTAAGNAQDDADQAIADALAAANAASDADSKATNAATAASTADGKAVAAQTAASNAASAASTADGKAVAAQTTASNAASAASTADGKAVAAQNTANAKGKVIIQSAAPAAADRLVQNLWIDTTNGANTPKRWVSGTTWSVVTDKAATDAAAAAVTAQNAASAAQSRADDAHTIASGAATAASAAASAASAAQTAANNAQTTANGKNKIVRSTADASSPGNYVAGDQWWKYNGTQITAMWIHSGSAWVSQTLTDSVITNLNAGSITAGTISAARLSATNIKSVLINAGAIQTANIAAGAITAASGIIADLAIGTAKIIDGSITTAKIKDLAVTNAEIANGTIQHAKIGSVDASKISVGTLNAGRIAANSMSLDKLVVGDLTNLIPDPYFENKSVSMPRLSGDVVPVSDPSVPTLDLPQAVKNAYVLPATYDLFVQQNANAFEVKPGDKFYVDAWVAHTGTETTGLSFRVWCSATQSTTNSTDQGGWSYPGSSVSAASAQDKWVRHTGVITIPAVNTAGTGVKTAPRYGWAALGPGNKSGWMVGSWSLRRMAQGELIVDGAITADKISVGAVVADKIAAEAVAADKIAAGAVTAEKIYANAVTADKIAADAVIADKIASNAVTADKIVANAITAEKVAADAIDAMTIRGAQIYGGYMEAPVIASSDKLGSGANVLTDPSVVSTIDTAWVASGHLGDTASRSQVDTMTWDRSWTDQYWNQAANGGYGGTANRTRRNWGSVRATATLSPRTTRTTGSLLFSNLSWFNTSARSISNPVAFVNKTYMQLYPLQGGGVSDPSWAGMPGAPSPVAGTARTTYLTNSSAPSVVAGERWNARIGFSRVAASFLPYVSVWVEIVQASNSSVLWTRAATTEELLAGYINDWWDSTYTGAVKFRIKVTYTAGGLANFIRRSASGNYARQSTSGSQDPGAWSHTATSAIQYGASPTTVASGSFMSVPHSGLVTQVTLRSALLAKVEPTSGWRLTEEDGLELFNSLGARTGKIDGEDNYFSGRFSTKESGARWQIENTSLQLYNAANQQVGGMYLHSNGGLGFSGPVTFQGDTDWTNISIRSPFAIYGTGGFLRYRKRGNTVELQARLTCTTANHLQSNSERVMGVLPAAVRPSEAVYVLCQGSGNNKWLLNVKSNGDITGARYDGTHNNNVWLLISTSWTL